MEKMKTFIANPIYVALSTFISSIIIAYILKFGLEYNKINLEHTIIPVAMIFFYIYVKTFKTGSKGMPKDFRIKYSILTTLLFLGFKIFEFYYLTTHSSITDAHIFIRTTLMQALFGGSSIYLISGKFIKRERSGRKNVIVDNPQSFDM